MTQVSNGLLGKLTLAEFKEPLILGQEFEDLLKVLKMLLKCGTVYKNIVEKDDHTNTKQWLQCCIHSPWNVFGAPVKPNDMTVYSN